MRTAVDECAGAPPAAETLDAELFQLARQEARCRLLLGRLARRFLRRRLYHELAFARLGDWTRERLGLSAREVQSLAQVSERLETLPSTRAAFLAGELSWTQTRLLAQRATRENEVEWLGLASGRSLRVLEAFLGRAAPDDDGAIDGEPAVTVRVPCPRRVRARWHETCELASRMAGAALAPWQKAESVAAEALSARGMGPEGPSPPLSEPGPQPRRHSLARPGGVDWAARSASLSLALEGLDRDLRRLDAFRLEKRLRTARSAMQQLDAEMGSRLAVFLALGAHRRLGFADADHYARERLGMSGRKARALVAIERKARQVPQLLEAYHAGRLSWLGALTVLGVAGPERGPAWVARAEEVTLKRLIHEVEWARAMRDVGHPWQEVAPPPAGANLDWQIRAREESDVLDAEVRFFAPLSVAALFGDAIRAYTDPGEPPWRGLDRLFTHVRETWLGQPRHRDPVFARDNWRCAVPACSARRNLHDHHIVFRSRGGDNRRDNRVVVCAWHHLRGIHAGRVRAWGQAPDRIHWQLGVRAGRRFLDFLGERYVQR